ncbi:MAG TPA: hypothetical protein VIL00_07895 [Pseudonocardiaceae bacterium]
MTVVPDAAVALLVLCVLGVALAVPSVHHLLEHLEDPAAPGDRHGEHRTGVSVHRLRAALDADAPPSRPSPSPVRPYVQHLPAPEPPPPPPRRTGPARVRPYAAPDETPTVRMPHLAWALEVGALPADGAALVRAGGER